MPTETPQIFHGDGRSSENPADFLKSFNRAMRQQAVVQLSDKLDAYGDYLGTSSQAETWFKALSSADKVTWTAFVAAFEKRWPPVIIAEKTRAEYERDLLDHILSSTEVGKKTTLYDRECWTHVAWAAKTLQFATSAGIEQSTSMIWQVRSKLPDVVKDMLKDEEYKSWAEFTKAVTELKGNRLVEKQEQHNRQTQELNALKTDLARIRQRVPVANSMDALQNQFSRMSVNTPNSPTAPSTTSAYTRIPGTQANQNTQSTYSRQPATAAASQPFVATEELKTSVRQLVASMPHHPDTPAGNAAYGSQLAQWNAKWGEATRVTHETGYPLKPGTAAIGSSECFACGTHGHNGRNCQLPLDHAERLTRKEAAWRAIVSRVLGAFNRNRATPISLVVNYVPQQPTAWLEELIEQNEGKVEGSAPIVTAVASPFETINVIDLYSVEHISTTKAQLEAKEAVPFIHHITLKGPKGEVVRIRALFDDGAMVAAMCSSIFHKIKHRLHNWGPSSRKLRMANGNIIDAEAKWSGTIEINGIQADGNFEVFDSGGGWAFLFGKPLLQSFQANHDYKVNSITI
ncbi:hypothetical protein EDD22DRAFT_787862, partial [Suillus occidentalis]